MLCFVATLLLEVSGAQGNYPSLFFNMSVAAHDATTGSAHWTQIHLLRVPKASSSAISAIARRAVGCSPPGPCCKYPGDPPGTCPNPHLFNCSRDNTVIGCTGHNPNYEALLNRSVPSITMVRNPISRSISAFFYPGAHHNSNCTEDINVCFLKYTQQTQWSNVLTKMLTGSYAYSDVQTCASVKQCNHSLELAQRNLRLLTFVGVSECWELSLYLLHRRLTSLTPQLQEFEMGSGISNTGIIRQIWSMKILSMTVS